MNRNLSEQQFHAFDVEHKGRHHRIVLSRDYTESEAHLIATQMALNTIPHRELGPVTLRV